MSFLKHLSFTFFLFPYLSFAAIDCGFAVDSYKAGRFSSNNTPLFISDEQFSQKTHTFLQERKNKIESKYQKAVSRSQKQCPQEVERARRIVQKILFSTQIAGIKEDSLEIILLCSKKNMNPIAKIIAAKYLIIPISLINDKFSDDSIAAVLSHEIAHFTLKHHARLYEDLNIRNTSSRDGKSNSLQQVKRRHELEADLTGLELLSLAGFDPMSSVNHLKTVSELIEKKKGKKSKNEKRRVKKMVVHDPYDVRAQILLKRINDCLVQKI